MAFWHAHARIEQHLDGSGIDAVVLRPTTYATTMLGWLQPVLSGVLPAPAAGARVAFVDPVDVAGCSAVLLQQPEWRQRRFTLSGPTALDFDQVAQVFADLLDRPVGFVAVPDDAALTGLLQAGAPRWFAENVLRVFGALRAGEADLTTGAVRDLTGGTPRQLGDALRPWLAGAGVAAPS